MRGLVAGPSRRRLGLPAEAAWHSIAGGHFVPVTRTIHNNAQRPTLGVLDHQDDRFYKLRVKLMGDAARKQPFSDFMFGSHLSLLYGYCDLSVQHVHEDIGRQASLGGNAQVIAAAAFAYGMPGMYTGSSGMISVNWSARVCANRFVCASPVRSRMAIAVFMTEPGLPG